MSKTNDELSKVCFNVSRGSGGSSLTSVALDNPGKRLIFTTDETVIQCDLTELYNTKQDKIADLNAIRLNALSDKEAREILERKEQIWDKKSVVTASDLGDSTNRIKFITIDGTEYKIDVDYSEVQEKLVAGENLTIDHNVISAHTKTYIAGEGINIDENDKISVTDDILHKDYEELENKPSINRVTLLGAILGKDLKLDNIEYITYREYMAIEEKERKFYFVCKNSKDVEAENCWRIYLQNKLLGEWDIQSGTVTLPKFPMRFPFRLG